MLVDDDPGFLVDDVAVAEGGSGTKAM